jgi:tetratricopeptide (TPR) repeat protein
MSLSLRSVCFVLAITLPAAAFGQSNKPKDYSKELCVIEKALTHITVADDGSDDRHQESVVRMTSQAGVEQFGLLKLQYAKASTSLKVDYVRVRKPDGQVIETSLDAIDDMPADITRQAPQYSDLREKHIAVKGLAVGDLLEMSYSLHTKPLVPGQFYEVFNLDESTLAKSITMEIDVPASKPLKIRSQKIKPVIKEENGRRLHKWAYEVKEIKKHAAEAIPEPADVLLTTFANWNDVGQWWKSLAAESTEPTQEIQAKAKYLTAAAKTDEEKARILYNYVSSQFRYIGINFGIGRYQPHPALDVFQNGFGDCKDKYALLAALLKTVGISSQPALLNLERLIDPEVPSPAQFDHVVLVAKVNGKDVWLDPTLEVAPYGFLAFIERNRYALLMRDGASTLEKTPEGTSHPSSFDFDAEGELSSEGILKGHFVSSTQGSLAIVFRSAFRSLPQAKWQELAQSISHGQGFAGQVSNVEVTGIDDTEKPLRISYDYERRNYSDFEDLKISPPMPPTGLSLREDPGDPNDPLPKEIFLGEPADLHFHAKIKLPQGFGAILPSNATVHTDFIDYSSSMSIEGSILRADRKISSKKDSLPQTRRPDFLKFGREVYDSEISMVRLQRPGRKFENDSADDTGNTITLNQEGMDDAKLFEQARNSLVSGRHEAAERTLKQLIQKNPSYPNAHAMLATVYMARNQQDRVADEFDKEFTGNPEAVMSYRMYAGYLTSQRRFKEARAVWARCVKNLPQIADAWQSMAEVDGYLENYPNAITEIKKAIELDPDSSTSQLTYGNLLLKSGEKEKGFEILLKGVADDPKADFLNTTAYEMADMDYRLDKAEELAKQAVTSLEAETTRIQLGNITSFDLRRMPSLSAYWDTLGWVYFKEGKLEDAQRYLRAAWELSPRDVIASHVNKAYEKAGKVSPAANKGYEKTQELRSARLTLAFPTPENGEFYFLFGEGGKLDDVQYISGGQRMKTPASIALIKRAHFHTIVPPGNPQTRVIRRGSIFCSGSNSPCMAVLFEVTEVGSTTEERPALSRQVSIRK